MSDSADGWVCSSIGAGVCTKCTLGKCNNQRLVLLKPIIRGLVGVTEIITGHEQTQLNRI